MRVFKEHREAKIMDLHLWGLQSIRNGKRNLFSKKDFFLWVLYDTN